MLDRAHAVALAGLAAPALDVEREAARLVAAGARLRHQAEQLADEREGAGVGGGVERGVRPMGLWSMAMTLSIASGALERPVAPGLGGGAVEPAGQRPVEDVVHQRRLARAGSRRSPR